MQKLLIVDDDEATRKVLRFRLKDSYEIIDTASPEEALELTLQHKPDAILLDLMMPQYSGFEVCQTLSSLSFTQNIPILVVSGESSASYQDFCEGLGAKGYFQKPVDMDALQRKLVKVIEAAQNNGHAEPRVLLRVLLRLRWTGPNGSPTELLTMTENVNATSFLCPCQALLAEGTEVEVRLARDAQRVVGKARVTRVDRPGTPGQMCDFQFVGKPTDWILR